MKLRQV